VKGLAQLRITDSLALLADDTGRDRIERAMSQSTIQEIERAIATLTPREVEELYVWLDEHYPQPIDTRLQSDLASGRLDKAISRALADEGTGRVRPV